MGPEDGIDKLCFLKQLPDESVSELKARCDCSLNALRRFNVEFQDKILMLIFFVKLVYWKEIKNFEPKTLDDVFNVSFNLASKNKGPEQYYDGTGRWLR